MSANTAKFKRRWLISGRLKNTSPFHIGSGFVNDRAGMVRSNHPDESVKVSRVVFDAHPKPYIPGSSLKGCLRAHATKLFGEDFSSQIFGFRDSSDDSSVGGKADFLDSTMVADPSASTGLQHWSESLSTGVTVSTQIERRTRTVSDKHLFHTEYVPAGAEFKVRIGGADINDESDFDEIVKILATLEGFNIRTITLGAENVNGWGFFDWIPERLSVLDASAASDWVGGGCREVGNAIGRLLVHSEFDQLVERAKALASTDHLADRIEIGITLEFDANFLVNDTTRTGEGASVPNQAPMLDRNGNPYLPSKSFRGAFRSQAERILRTIRGSDGACYPDGLGRRKCAEAKDEQTVRHLCPACRLFGATGWRSPISLSDFSYETAEVEFEPTRQEFVAIDRFTGGSASGAKFWAQSAFRPKLEGKMSIDQSALRISGSPEDLLGLLTLTLRDLCEGDITFGFGSAKGYGRCTARIGYVAGQGEFAAELAAYFRSEAEQLELKDKASSTLARAVSLMSAGN